MSNFRIGIDLGGTKTEILALNTQSQELLRKRIPTPRDNYNKTLHAICDLVFFTEAELNTPYIPVGVGIPGTISKKSQRVKNANATWLNGQRMQKDLSVLLSRDVKISNDANCLAVSEATDGSGAGHDLVFAGILGTGCGAGIAHLKQPISGLNGLTGEWGHNPLPWTADKVLNARPCFCGQSGCQETFLSGTGLSLSYQFQAGEVATAKDIVALANAGDSCANQTLDTYIEHLSRGLAAVINTLDPDIIVLGGGASNISKIYEEVPKRLTQYVFGGECHTPIIQAKHGDSSGVRGAAWLNS